MRIVKPDKEYGLDPYYLIYPLSHELTQRQLPHKVMIDTTLPNISDRWKELYLPIHKYKHPLLIFPIESRKPFRESGKPKKRYVNWALNLVVLSLRLKEGNMPLTGIELLVIAIVRDAILSNTRPTYEQIARALEYNSEYRGTRKGKTLEREVKRILAKEEVLRQLHEETASENNIHGGFKIGRLEINGKFKLD